MNHRAADCICATLQCWGSSMSSKYASAPWHRAAETEPDAWVNRQLNRILRYNFEFAHVQLDVVPARFYEKYWANVTVEQIEHCMRSSLRNGESYFAYGCGASYSLGHVAACLVANSKKNATARTASSAFIVDRHGCSSSSSSSTQHARARSSSRGRSIRRSRSYCKGAERKTPAEQRHVNSDIRNLRQRGAG